MRNYIILKNLCRKIFLVGSGNIWYEGNVIGDDRPLYYRMCNFLLLSTYCIMTVLEMMAIVMGDFPEDEKQDCISFVMSHTLVLIKVFFLKYKKASLKRLNQSTVEVCEQHEHPSLMAEKYRIMKINIVAYCAIVFGACFCYVMEGLRKLHEGSHFVTVVTYYPSYDNNSLPATAFRILTTAILHMMMVTMILSVDSYTMICLIMYTYKLITLRHYFEGLKDQFDRLSQSRDVRLAVRTLKAGLIEGIVMHGHLLSLLQDIDKVFGLVLALQLCQTVSTSVPLLLQIGVSDQMAFAAKMKIVFFVVALFFLLGLFMCNAGEITYQASLLSDAIFKCGWHLCPAHALAHDPRRLVLLATMQAQRPLLMKAFKMLPLTYGTFLQVIRGTYSIFALFNAQNK